MWWPHPPPSKQHAHSKWRALQKGKRLPRAHIDRTIAEKMDTRLKVSGTVLFLTTICVDLFWLKHQYLMLLSG